VRKTVEGLSTVACGVSWRPGDNVVTDEIEFPANIYPWLNLKARYGVDTKLVPAPNGKVVADDLIAACDNRTRLVTVSFVQFSNGYRADLERLGAFCRSRGIYLCVDGIQGVGPLQVDVTRFQVDFLACGGHKWLLGPIGIGFLYIRKEIQPDIWPSEVGHLGVRQNIEKYTEYNMAFRPTAEKFEGGVHNYAGAFGFDAALTLIHEFGPANVESRVLMLTDQLCEGIVDRGYRLLSHRAPSEKSGTVAFVSDRQPAKDIFHRLMDAGIFVTISEGAIRVAPHFYNTPDEIERLLATLSSTPVVSTPP